MLIAICVKFRHDITSGSLKTNLTKNFNLRGIDEQTNGRTYRQRVVTSNLHIFLNNDMLIVICVKFHHDRTSASFAGAYKYTKGN